MTASGATVSQLVRKVGPPRTTTENLLVTSCALDIEEKMTISIITIVIFTFSISVSSYAWSNQNLHFSKSTSSSWLEPRNRRLWSKAVHELKSSSGSATDISSTESEEYTVTLGLPPLGIVFEEVEPVGYAGVKVTSLVTGGKGDQCKKIQVGDRLKYTTAIKFLPGSSNYKVVVVDCRGLDFDTIVSAIGSNQERFGVDGVELTFCRAKESQQSESM